MMTISRIQRSGITVKYTFLLEDKELCHAAYVVRPEKHIICLSSQIGCAGGCRFCSAAHIPLKRNLTAQEMDRMILTIMHREKVEHPTLLSFMGTGEPMANLDEVLQGISWWEKIPGFRFAISASGTDLERIEQIPIHVKMQFTLTSVDEVLRHWLQPNIGNLSQLAEAIHKFRGARELSVPLIEGFNDSYSSICGIAVWARKLSIHVKLNHLNPIHGFNPSAHEKECLQWLLEQNISAELYTTDGSNINAACGQFEVRGL